MVIAVLCEFRAKKQVKEQLRRQGIKVSSVSVAEIKVMAGAWMVEHRDELIADAKRMIASSPELTKMYEKEQRQRAKLESDAQSKSEPISTTSAMQMSGEK
jgi:hypothetical protein